MIGGRTFGPHGEDDVGTEALAGPYLVGDLQRDLDGHQVRALAGAAVVLPGVRRAQEVLVLDVHESLRLANGAHVGVLNGEVHNLPLGCATVLFTSESRKKSSNSLTSTKT